MIEILTKVSRDPDIPFYWLAARLWFVIALERIASEMPSAISKHGLWLLDVAADDVLSCSITLFCQIRSSQNGQ